MIEIKNRWTGAIICTGKTLKKAVLANLANLSGADLSGADLNGADLSGANLTEVDLSGANLRGADLTEVDLSGADLSGADLSGADLNGADLRVADLRGANLLRANLRVADLRGADLSGADLSVADLRGANLTEVDLSGAYLSGAYLSGADLNGAYLSGAEIAWQSHDLIAEILKRSSGDDTAKLKVAGFILICREKCWSEFLDIRDPLAGWAIGVLADWVQDGDGAPDCVRVVAEQKKHKVDDDVADERLARQSGLCRTDRIT